MHILKNDQQKSRLEQAYLNRVIQNSNILNIIKNINGFNEISASNFFDYF